MKNNSILLINPDFDPKFSEKLSLLVKIGIDTFSYAIVDEEQKLVYAVYDEQECEDGYVKFNERLKADAYLKLSYKDAKIAAHTSNMVFVPQELFQEKDIPVYTKFFEVADSSNVYIQPSSQQNFHTVFSLPQAAEKLIDENWENNIKLQQNAGLIELASTIKEDSLIIDFTVGSFQLVYTKEGQIVFSQSYQFDDIEELTYYLLLIINQLNFDASHIEVKVCGIINQGDDKWNLLSQYFNKVDLLTISSQLDTNILDDMPRHYYTSLLALQQCG